MSNNVLNYDKKRNFLKLSSELVKSHIIWYLMAYKYLSFQDIQKLVNKSKGTVHFHIQKLIEANIICEIHIDNSKHANMKFYKLNIDLSFTPDDVPDNRTNEKDSYIYSLFKQVPIFIHLAEKMLQNTRKQFESIIKDYEEATRNYKENKTVENKDKCDSVINLMERTMEKSTISIFPLTEEKYIKYKNSLEKILKDILSADKIDYSPSDKQIFSIFSIGVPSIFV